jgi:Bacterial Ig domain/Right handed beta helix region
MMRLSAAFATLAGAVLAAVLLTVVPRAGGADCTSTASSTSALSSALGSAGTGATLCLADGSYGRLALTGTKAAPGVTVRAEHPGKATIDGATLTGANITLADLNVTDEITIAAGSSGMTISHNKITGGYLGVNLSSDDQQISDTAIVGNQFVGPFGEDAIRANRYHDGPDADPYGLLVEGNEITGVRENGNHSDCLQAVWVGDGMYFRKNYLHDNRCQGFFIKDQASTVSNVVAEDNLFLRNDAACAQAGCGQPSIFQLFGPMTGLVVRRNTIWTPGGGSPTTLRDGGWGSVTIDSNVIYRPWSDTSAPFGSGYSATNNVAGTSPEGTWPSTGFSVVASPSFADPAHDDYRTGDGRGVDWAPADQQYGPGAADTTPPPPDDTTPPSTTISSGPSGSTTATSASFAFTSSESGSTFECKLDSGSFASCTSPKTYTGLATGQHTFSVRATDAAGNVDDSPATATWTIAGQPGDSAPDTTITSGPSGPTNDATPAFAFQSSESGSTFECRVDEGSWATCSSPWTTAALADGDHSVSVRATDADDNTDGSPAVRTFTVDTQAPKTSITSAPSGTIDSAQASVAFTIGEAGATSECRLDDGAWVACTSPYAITGLGDGGHTVVVRSRDAAGNVESPGASASWTVALPGGGDPGTPAGAAPSVDLDVATGGRALALTATADDDNGVARVEFWVDGRLVDTDDATPYAARVYTRGLVSGSHTVSVRAFDAAGQAASSARTARISDTSYGRRWSIGSTELTSADNGDGAIHLSGRTNAVGASVGLAKCDDADGDVVDRFDMDADDRGRLDLVYAGKALCVVELRSRWR